MKTWQYIRAMSFGKRNTLPLIMQTESAECALACLAMVAGYYGHATDLHSLRTRMPVSNRGVDIQSLVDMADRMDLAARPLRLEPDEIAELAMPCILHWGMNHFVVLKSVKNHSITIHDPAVGSRTLSLAEFNHYFTGVALELTPTSDFQQASRIRKMRLRDCWSTMTGLRRSVATILVLSFVLQLFAVLAPLYLQISVDQVVMKSNMKMLLGLSLAFGALLLIQVTTTSLREYVLLHMQFRMNVQMSANLFRHLIRLPMDYFIKRHIGDIVSRFGSLDQIRQVLTTGIVTAIVDGVMSALMLVAMMYYDVQLTLIVLCTSLLYITARIFLFKPFRRATQETIASRASMSSHFLESVRAVQTIKLFQKENDRLQQWQNRVATTLNNEVKLAGWHVNYGLINALMFGAENLVVIYLAIRAVGAGRMTLGMFYAFLTYKACFIHVMDSLVTNWLEYRVIDVHLERLSDIVFSPVDNNVPMKTGDEPLDADSVINGTVEARNLGFRYSEQEPFVFRNLNFTIAAGESVAITGRSGCGKTTLLKCLLGLLQPTEGQILIDGADVTVSPGYRRQVAAVMQEDQLLSGSLASNIACFDSMVDMDQVLRCARMACVESEILSMPMTFNTLVGDLGTTLSGGQKQRVLLARALYRQPRILFMDEATSHLDVEIESRLSHNIRALNITRVIVAHRPQTIRSADRHIALFAGAPVDVESQAFESLRSGSGDR